MIKAILACEKGGGIGYKNSIPWKHKDDMNFFRMVTIGWGNNVVVMGRKTKESLPVFPLPGRGNCVISSSGNCDFDSIEDFKQWVDNNHAEWIKDVWIIGGASIYNKTFEESIPEEIYINIIDGDYKCDTFIDWNIINKNYNLKEQKRFDDYTFEIWERK